MPLSPPPTIGLNFRDSGKSMGVNYTNTTGKILVINVQGTATGAGPCGFLCTINGQNVGTYYFTASSSAYGCAQTFVIPPGATYMIQNNAIGSWTWKESY